MDVSNLTLITMAAELSEQGVSVKNISSKLGKHRETIGLWLKGVREFGLEAFLNNYEQAKKGSRVKRQIDPVLKRLVWSIREREMDCCGEKIGYFLQKEHNIKIANSKIYEILAEKFTLRSKWRKNQKRGLVPEATKPREVVQMDSVDFCDIYAFTGVDIFSKEVDVLLAPELTANFGNKFLEQSMTRRFNSFVNLIQTDGGSEFKDEFKRNVRNFCDRHRVARPYRKNEQSYIESFNRTIRKECLGWVKYRVDQLPQCQFMVESFIDRYHYHRPHMGIGMKPPLERI